MLLSMYQCVCISIASCDDDIDRSFHSLYVSHRRKSSTINIFSVTPNCVFLFPLITYTIFGDEEKSKLKRNFGRKVINACLNCEKKKSKNEINCEIECR